MSNLYKLKDVCRMHGITRRTIQGYEKIGLINPTAKNERGHLLYDEETIRRIVVISFLNEALFPLEDIKSCIDGDPEDFKSEVKDTVNLLEMFIKNEKFHLDALNDISKLNFSDQDLIDQMYQIITDRRTKLNEKDN